MRRTRSTSTTEPLSLERRSTRLMRETGEEGSGNMKLKRNSLEVESYTRSSPRRKIVKLATDIDNKNGTATPHRKHSSKHFTRAAKRVNSSPCPSKLDKAGHVVIQDVLKTEHLTRAKRKVTPITVTHHGEENICTASHTKNLSLCQANGHETHENGLHDAPQPPDSKHLTRSTSRNSHSKNSGTEGICGNDRPITRLSSTKDFEFSKVEDDDPESENMSPITTAAHTADVVEQHSVASDTNGPLRKNNIDKDRDKNETAHQVDSKDKLNIEDLLEIEYQDAENDDFVGFAGKRKMNLRSSGVQCDPNYYTLSLELIKKSRSKSINGNSGEKHDHLKSMENSSESRHNFVPGNEINHFDSPQKIKNGSELELLDSPKIHPNIITNTENGEILCNDQEESTIEDINSTKMFFRGTTNNEEDISKPCKIPVLEAHDRAPSVEQTLNMKHLVDVDVELPVFSSDGSPVLCPVSEQGNMKDVDISEQKVLDPCNAEVPTSSVVKSDGKVKVSSLSLGEPDVADQHAGLTPKRKRGNLKSRVKEARLPEKPKVQMLFRDPSEPPSLFVEEAVPKSDVYYFESDHVALKHNKDYQGFLKAVALLEAQRHQCVHDIETLRSEKLSATSRPVAYVDELQTRSPLSKYLRPQTVATVPKINWQKYVSQYGTFSNVFGNDAPTTSVKPVTRKVRLTFEGGVPAQSYSAIKDGNRLSSSQSSRVTWTVEEQLKLEELLLKFPSEPVEFARFRKIAAALGNRTPLQVQSRVQKYFIKLAKAGLPIPGNRPRSGRLLRDSSSAGTQSRRARSHPQQSYLRASTFFPQLHCPVRMDVDEDDCSLPSTSAESIRNVGSEELASDEEDIPDELRSCSEYVEILRLKKLRKSKLADRQSWGRQALAQHTGYACDMCDSDPIQGVRYHCIDCPQETCVDLCQSCIQLHGQFVTDNHKPSHRMEPVYESQNFLDDDYMKFVSNSGEYNYLDPNFHPASI